MSQVTQAKQDDKDTNIAGKIARVSPPIAEPGHDVRVLFCIGGDNRVFSVYMNGNYSGPYVAFLIEKGDEVEFDLHPNTRYVKKMTVKGLLSDDD